VPYRRYSGQNCSIADALGVVGERWTLLIMREVLLGRRRFADIRDETGAATNILSDRLQTLVSHELLTRERYGEHPDAFEYRPTKKGDDTWPVIAALLAWGDAYGSVGGSPRVIVHTSCGHDADLRLHCSHCGEPVDTSELVTRPGPGANDKQRADGMLPSSSRSA
jgi:DNA-binding HxlR family transcriptional regulator